MQRAVVDLMTKDHVKEAEICKVVAQKGYYPPDARLSDYEPEFVTGWIIQYWDKVVEMIKINRVECPFENKN